MTALDDSLIIATTVENALLEILRRVADLQSNTTTTNPQNRIVITNFTQNELTGVYSVSLSIPANITMTENGVVSNAIELFLDY